MTKGQEEILREIQKTVRLLDNLLEAYISKNEESNNEESNNEEFASNVSIVAGEELEQIVTEYLRRLGVRPHLKGYYYLRDAIQMAVKDMQCLQMITKLLNPTIAKKNATTPSRVERGMRHAIETTWANGNLKILEEVFGYAPSYHKKPTNTEFIATIADCIRLNEK